jgi:hypothetical protein
METQRIAPQNDGDVRPARNTENIFLFIPNLVGKFKTIN